MAKRKFSIALALATLALAAIAPGQATITIDRVSGDGVTPGSRLRMLVSVTSNGSGQTPQGVALRVIHPSALSFGFDPPGAAPVITVEPADLGTPAAAPTEEVISPGVVGRDIATVEPNTASNPLLPRCFYVNFTVTAGVTVPYTMQVVADPDSSNPVPFFQVFPPLIGTISPLTFVGETITGPDINPNPASVSFATIDQGTSTTAVLNIENLSGTQELTVSSVSIVNNSDSAGTFTIASPPATPLDVATSGSLPLTLVFTPPSNGLFNSAVVQVVSNSPGENTITIPLSGTGLGLPDINPSPASVAFSDTDQGASSTASFTIQNVSATRDLTVSSISILNNGDPAGTFTIDSPPSTPLVVPASGSQPLTLRFSPPTNGLFDNAELQIVSNSPGENTITVPLSGTGLGLPDINPSPASVAFATIDQGTTTTAVLNIQNLSATRALTVSSISINNNSDPAGTFTVLSPPTTPLDVPALGSLPLTLMFAPASNGLFNSAVLQVASNSPGETLISVPLSGTALGLPDINLSPASVAFGNTDEGSSSTSAVSIQNLSATRDLTVSSITIINNGDPAGTFTIDSPPATPFDVPASGSQPLTLRFSPPTVGLFDNAFLQVVSNSPGETTVTLSLSGTGVVVSRVKDWKSLND